MIGVTAPRTEELLPLRVRLRGVGTIDEEAERRDHQQGWQIHLPEQEICPKNRSHPSASSREAALTTSYPSNRRSIAMDIVIPGSSSIWSTLIPFAVRAAVDALIGEGVGRGSVTRPRDNCTVKVDPSPTRDLMVTV